MKTTLLILCLLLTSAAFGQYVGISSQAQPYHPPSHPATATTHALAPEQPVVGGSTYSFAQGERPMWDVPRPPETPLGDTARQLRKEHSKLKKARVVYEN